MKIKTIVFEWGSMLQCIGVHDGPVVELNEEDVLDVEATSRFFLPDDQLNAYIYRKRGLSTIAVRYDELKNSFPELAKLAKESMIIKVRAPDPCLGSCT